MKITTVYLEEEARNVLLKQFRNRKCLAITINSLAALNIFIRHKFDSTSHLINHIYLELKHESTIKARTSLMLFVFYYLRLTPYKLPYQTLTGKRTTCINTFPKYFEFFYYLHLYLYTI